MKKKENKSKNNAQRNKVFLLLIILFLISFLTFFSQNKPEKTYTVIHIIEADKFYIDFNQNDKPDLDELVKLSGVNSIKPAFSDYLQPQLDYIGIDKQSGVLIGTLANNYAQNNLLYKNVKVKFIKEKLNEEELGYKFVQISLNDNDWGITLLKLGFATVYRDSKLANKYLKHENTYKIKENGKKESEKNFVVANLKTQKFHKMTCKYGQLVKDFMLLKEKDVPDFYEKCQFCYHENEKENLKQERKLIKNFDIRDGKIAMYFTDFTKNLKPSTELIDENGRALVRLISNAKKTIDIAAYGIDDNPTVTKALLNAKERGVKIRIVADKNTKGISPYKTTLIEKDFRNIVYDTDIKNDNIKVKDALMHNKFVIVDNQFVYTGSLNIAKNDLSGYNSNVSVIINSEAVANIYSQEFQQMFDGKFHHAKNRIPNTENIKLDNNTLISIYFSPQDNVIKTQIIPLINKAKKYIYVPIFSFTDNTLRYALANAHKRGVDVKIITDSANAFGKQNATNKLRKQGVKVKTENYAGKMHMKAMIIDDEYTILGSMNFSNAGQNNNDENTVIIKNSKLAQNFKNQFLYTFDKIHNKWLKRNPRAESLDSIGSCEDGVDNDFDGLVDKKDTSCVLKK